jgi:hypothetical protein
MALEKPERSPPPLLQKPLKDFGLGLLERLLVKLSERLRLPRRKSLETGGCAVD